MEPTPALATGGDLGPWWHPRRLIGQARPFPWESTIVNLVAVLVGVYAGLATGLLANFIALFQLLFFRNSALATALAGADRSWGLAFRDALAGSNWHVEYLAVAVTALATARLFSPLAQHRFLQRMPFFQKQRLQLIAFVLGAGLVLYYPVLLLAAFTKSFGETAGGLLTMLEHAPRLMMS